MHTLNKQTMRRKTHMIQTFESSQHDQGSHKFMMDKTIYKGIKQNDVSKIIDVGREGGDLEGHQMLSQQEEIQLKVIQMRRKYDEKRTETKKIENQVDKSKKLADNLKAEETKLKDHIDGAKQSLQVCQSQCKQLNDLVDARIYDFDIYKEMEARLKHDILIMKKRTFDKDHALKKEGVKLKTLKYQEFNKTRLSSRCKDLLQSVQKTVYSKVQERTTKINSFYQVLNKKHENVRKRQERGKEIEQVMMRAMSEKLQQQKQWINICLVNTFLKKFLKNKMERLIHQNQIVQNAYHKIKSSTDITDSQDLITRFLNREKNYGALLEAIAEKQNILEKMKEQRQKLEETNNILNHQAEQIYQNSIRNVKDCGPLQKTMQNLQQQLKHIKYKRQQLSKWATRFLCVYNNKTRDQIQQKYINKTNTDLLKDVLRQIGKYADHILGDENNSDNINTTFMSTKPASKTFDQEMIVRNNRVRTSALDDSVNEGDDRQGQYDGVSQADYLQYNRRATKKNDQSRRFRIKTQAQLK